MLKKSTHLFHIQNQAPHARMINNPSLWQQLPFILLYPLRGYALPFVLIFSVLLWLSLGNPFGIFIFVVVLMITLKYAYSVLDNTVLGYATPPEITFDTWNASDLRPFKQFVYLLVLLILTKFLSLVHGSLGILFFALGIFCLPASIVIIAHRDNLMAALNPAKLFTIIHKTGFRYLLASGLFFLTIGLSLPIFTLMPILSMVVNNVELSGFTLLLYILLVMYLFLMVFHLMGFIIYHRRYELGFEAVFSPERQASEQQEVHRQTQEALLDEVYRLAKCPTDEPAAIQRLLTGLAEYSDPKQQQHLYARTALWQYPAIRLAHGNYYLSFLIQQQQGMAALDIYQQCVTLNPDFIPQPPQLLFALAQQAHKDMNYALALTLLEGFLQHCPTDNQRVAAQLLVARLLAEYLQQPQQAKQIIGQLLKEKGHPLYPEIKQYALFLTQLV